MKRRGSNKKLIIGSFSIVSSVLLLTGIMIPQMIIYTTPSKIEGQIIDLHDLWDIIVPDDYKTIYEAIKNANENDRIFVKNGTYTPKFSFFSDSMKIDKEGIVLFGQSKNSTIINGRDIKYPIEVTADNVNISGFTIKNNGINGSLIYINSNNCCIENNILKADEFYDGTEYCIKLYNAHNNIIKNNTLNSADIGIYFSISDDNIIKNNLIENNKMAIDIGSTLLLNLDNRFTEKIYMKGCKNNIVNNNTISNNSRGVVVTSSDETHIINNKISSNNKIGIVISNSKNCVINNNNLIDNGLELYGKNLINYIHEIKGNFVNNKPLYYFLQKSKFKAPSDAGQIIIVDCNEVEIEKQEISNTSTAVFVVFSRRVEIIDSEFKSNYVGVYLLLSERCSVKWNNFIKNYRDAGFVVRGIRNRKTHKWKSNYWDNWLGNNLRIMRLTNKKIYGRLFFNREFKIFQNFDLGLIIKNIDRSPSPRPHQI